jgi:integrase
MSKRASLKFQFHSVINKCFVPKFDRHSLKIKINNKTATLREVEQYNTIIASYKRKDNLHNFVNNFINYLLFTDQYKNYKYLYELNSEIFSEFLKYKVESGAVQSKYTIKEYVSVIRRLERMCSYVFPSHSFNFTKGLVVPELPEREHWIKEARFSVEDYKAIIQYILNNRMLRGAPLGVLLCACFGLRVSEVLELRFCDVDYVNKKLHVPRGKGGGSRVLPCVFSFQSQLIDFIKEHQQKYGFSDNDQIIYDVQRNKKITNPQNVNDALKSVMRDMGIIHKIKDRRISVHALRKTFLSILYVKTLKEKK